jgi:ribosome-binding protein aMBF1 (putative translation factor)
MNLPTRQQVGEAFGGVLKNVRATTELSQEALAERAQFDVSYASFLERGERCPNLWVVLKIGIALEVDPALLITMTLKRLRGEL